MLLNGLGRVSFTVATKDSCARRQSQYGGNLEKRQHGRWTPRRTQRQTSIRHQRLLASPYEGSTQRCPHPRRHQQHGPRNRP
ncbi:unnamed protein product [Fusarium graminearum]|nr:unnamed protein product [Fusarium graminearum]VTO91789.1 unnamed protein product [Fusarium graminearum]